MVYLQVGAASSVVLKTRSYWSESESDNVFRWVHRESTLVFILSNNNQRKTSISLSVYEPLVQKDLTYRFRERVCSHRMTAEMMCCKKVAYKYCNGTICTVVIVPECFTSKGAFTLRRQK